MLVKWTPLVSWGERERERERGVGRGGREEEKKGECREIKRESTEKEKV